DDDREHVGRRAVGAQQDEIVVIFVLPYDAALHLILDDRFARQRRLEADHRLHAGRGFRRVAVTPAAVVELGAAFAAGLFPHLGELLGRRIAAISAPAGQELVGNLAVARRARELVERL